MPPCIFSEMKQKCILSILLAFLTSDLVRNYAGQQNTARWQLFNIQQVTGLQSYFFRLSDGIRLDILPQYWHNCQPPLIPRCFSDFICASRLDLPSLLKMQITFCRNFPPQKVVIQKGNLLLFPLISQAVQICFWLDLHAGNALLKSLCHQQVKHQKKLGN